MNEREDKRDARKKPYAKPKMRRVELRPQEAVLGACKSMGGTLGGGAGGTCSAVSCQSQGS
ncbi:MAG TPA: hypothetical protein VK619_19610 [Pyrinomonadaceae bacterium]|nr:hypothetical protein [Pyrinomonadaceae bacterium]